MERKQGIGPSGTSFPIDIHFYRFVRHRFGWKQFCCKACLDTYLTRTTREAHRSRSWLEFLARKE
jgi:hypothetical protein